VSNNKEISKGSSSYAEFKKYAIVAGRITVVLAMVFSFLPGLFLAIFEGVWPGFDLIIKAFTPIFFAFIVIWIIEPISYFPILGLTGTFVSWLSGNILNLRIPTSVISQKVANVEEGTEEGDIFSTIGLCVSVFVNIIIVFIFAISGAKILQVLPESVKEAFDYMLPAIMGSMMLSFALRNIKVAIAAIIIAVIVKYFAIGGLVDVIFILVPTIAISLFMYKKGII